MITAILAGEIIAKHPFGGSDDSVLIKFTPSSDVIRNDYLLTLKTEIDQLISKIGILNRREWSKQALSLDLKIYEYLYKFDDLTLDEAQKLRDLLLPQFSIYLYNVSCFEGHFDLAMVSVGKRFLIYPSISSILSYIHD